MCHCVPYGGAGGPEVKERMSDVDYLTASMALRRAPLLSRLTSASSNTPAAAFPAAAAYGLLAAGEKSIYSLYNSLISRLQPAALGLNPAAVAAAAAAAAIVRPPTMTVFPSPLAVAPSAPATPRAPAVDISGSSNSETKSSTGSAGSIVQTNALLNGGHRYRPYMPPLSLATVAKRLDTNSVRQSN